MKFGWKLFWFAGCVLCLGVRSSAAPVITTAPDLEYSQDGTTWEAFDELVGRQKVKNYYNYYGLSGHPAFGTKRNAATAAVYWDKKRKALSLIIINGQARHGFRNAVGEVRYTFSSLSPATYVSMKDDPGDINYKSGNKTGTAHFTYKSSTDGLVLSGLEQRKLAPKVEIEPLSDLNTWRLVDGNPKKGGSFVTLDMDKPLYIRQANVNSVPPTGGSGGNNGGTPGTGTPGTGTGTPGNGTTQPPAVPEPGAALGVAAAVLGLLGRRQRR